MKEIILEKTQKDENKTNEGNITKEPLWLKILGRIFVFFGHAKRIIIWTILIALFIFLWVAGFIRLISNPDTAYRWVDSGTVEQVVAVVKDMDEVLL